MSLFLLFFFNDTATTEIYTLSLHDALPICPGERQHENQKDDGKAAPRAPAVDPHFLNHADGGREHHGKQRAHRSEEHTSELQSQSNLVCRLLLEKKKKRKEN